MGLGDRLAQRASLLRAAMISLDEERGVALNPSIRREMERGLHADFRSVTLHDSPASHAIARRLGARAFNIENRIGFAAGAFETTTEAGRRVLAHELAHVVQRRLRNERSVPPHGAIARAALEHEADLAADAVCNGRSYTCRQSAHSQGVLCWDIAGHYYTTYLCFLNARADVKTARHMATWAWLPDQVAELEAAGLMFSEFENSPFDNALISGSVSAKANAVLQAEGYKVRSHWPNPRAPDVDYIRRVHAGLHVLNGGNADEQAEIYARRFLASTAEPELYRGIGLHPLGDCYAHRVGTSSTLYSPFVGHGLDGHDPDNLWEADRAAVYLSYVTKMSEVANGYVAKGSIVPLNDLKVALSSMLQFPSPTIASAASQPAPPSPTPHPIELKTASSDALALSRLTVPRTEDGCSAHIAKVAAELLKVPMIHAHPYSWLRKTYPWSEYFQGNFVAIRASSGGLQSPPKIFCEIVKRVGTWCNQPLVRAPGR